MHFKPLSIYIPIQKNWRTFSSQSLPSYSNIRHVVDRYRISYLR